MDINTLHRIFENTEKPLSFEDAKEKAFLFLKSVDNVEDLGGDYWIQLSREWDLNIWWENDTSIEMTLYQCALGEDGKFFTCTSDGFVKIA